MVRKHDAAVSEIHHASISLRNFNEFLLRAHEVLARKHALLEEHENQGAVHC